MDKNQLVNEIVEEVEGFGDSTKKKELIELFVTVMLIKTDATELAGVADRQYVAYLKLFDQDASMNDIKLCLSDVLKIEPLLKKILYLVDENKYLSIHNSNSGLADVIYELGLNPQRRNLNEKYERYINDPVHMNLLKAYQLRNIESHTYESWGRRAIFENLDSVIITCLNAINKNLLVIKNSVKKETIKNTINVERYLKELIDQFKTRMSRFIHIRGEENFSVLGSYVIESQDENAESKRRSGTVESLRDHEIPEKRMMIWGEAGMGKSTTLEYLSYIDAKKDEEMKMQTYLF